MLDTVQPAALDLAPIKERLDKATKGPWVNDDFFAGDTDIARVGVFNETSGYFTSSATICVCETNHREKDELYPGEALIGPIGAERNAAFIAHARTDISALIAEVERLNGRYDEVVAALENCEARLIHLYSRMRFSTLVR